MMTSASVVDAGGAAEIEALIPEARERSRQGRRRTVVVAAGLVMTIAVSTVAVRTWAGDGPGAAHWTAGIGTPLNHSGNVDGYIEPCVGVERRLAYPAGVVTVRRGAERAIGTYPGPLRFVIPANVLATELVKANRRFSFRLPPGRYVLVARFERTATSFLNVSIRAGVTARQNIPVSCK